MRQAADAANDSTQRPVAGSLVEDVRKSDQSMIEPVAGINNYAAGSVPTSSHQSSAINQKNRQLLSNHMNPDRNHQSHRQQQYLDDHHRVAQNSSRVTFNNNLLAP